MNLRQKKLSGTILIAEDDYYINKLFQFYLKNVFQGTILSSFDGSDAVNKCLKETPDLIFLDINMPIKDGITVIKEIRKEGYKNPILVITAYGERFEKECYQHGADIVLFKPLGRKEFLQKLYRYFPQKASETVS